MIDYHPLRILFSIGPIQVYSIGVAFFMAFLVGYLIAIREIKRRELDVFHFKKMFFAIVLGAIIGARLFHVFGDITYYLTHPLGIFMIWKGGASSYGGFIGGFLFPFVYFLKHKLDFWSYADAVTPSICMGIFIKRIGCFLNWCCYGLGSSLPWAVNAGDYPRHPTQVYLALNGLILFFIFSRLKYKQKFPGWLFMAFMVCYSVSRFFIEFLRDSERFLNLTGAQWIEIFILALAVLFLYFKEKRARTQAC